VADLAVRVDVHVEQHHALGGREFPPRVGLDVGFGFEQIRVEAGFLADLAAGRLARQFVSVEVAAGRDPLAESVVVVQGDCAVVNDVDGRGEVAGGLHVGANEMPGVGSCG
jgi:hypothetical protein